MLSSEFQIGLWILFITLCTGGLCWLCCKVNCISCINRLADCYLNCKYRNYQVNAPEIIDYWLTQIELILVPYKTHYKMEARHDLNKKRFNVTHSELSEKTSDFKKKIGQHPKNILIHFEYHGQPYLLPLEFNPKEHIKLPLYTADDLATCLRIEYNEIETKYNKYSMSDEAMLKIAQYAGPKGNFYCDTPYAIKPSQLGQILSDDTDDFLQLTTIFGDKFRFNRNEIINFQITS